ncbi:MAG: RNA methyltransferase [Lachnospiraceae bacterium]|nr:RNA methyltransferase [Lachnospiraceae bacterium]
MEYTEIKSLSDERISLYIDYNENQLFHVNEPAPGYFVAESCEVIERALNASYEPVSFLAEKENITDEIRSTMDKCNVPVYVGTHDVLKNIAGYGLTRGMLCMMKRKTLISIAEFVSEILSEAKTIVILEDVMNPTNVGAIVRSAAAMNIDALLFTSGCADPLYRRASRVSMGTVFQMPWTFFDKKTGWPDSGIKILKESGFSIIATALLDDTLDIRDERIKNCEKKAIILGTEGTGIRKETLELCDYTVKIPMAHGVDSLNVAAASAVTFWEMTR